MRKKVTAMKIDFAKKEKKDEWLRHPIYGDPSFDSFEHDRENPVLIGKPPYEWPVNGFLFNDPKGTGLYCYVGNYLQGYRIDSEYPACCTVFHSKDDGKTWEELGSAFPKEKTQFTGCEYHVGESPDVSVIYHDGRCHMTYDWGSDNNTWATMRSPIADKCDSGCGYAVADSPQGPFIRDINPIYKNSGNKERKYNRFYATSLQKRKEDYIFFILADSTKHFGWALYAITAPTAQGPFSEPVRLLSPDGDDFHPPLMEFFPTFTYEGYVYAPATSVAGNRNFQVIWRAPIEKAEKPESWEIYMHGSIWHSEPIINEYSGIFGQTITGFVGEDGVLRVMFPSKNDKDCGTINIARRRWDQPYRDGFVLSGHLGPSITLLRHAYRDFKLKTSFKLVGKAILLWNYRGALYPEKPTSNSVLEETAALSFCDGLELSADIWRLIHFDKSGARIIIAEEGLSQSPSEAEVFCESGKLTIRIDGRENYKSDFRFGEGPIGLYTEPHSHLRVSEFEVEGECLPASLTYLYDEGLLGAAQHIEHFQKVEDDLFRFEHGKISLTEEVRVKWNFIGTGYKLWSPKSPEFGQVRLILDGKPLGQIDLSAQTKEKSRVVSEIRGLNDGFHNLIVERIDKRMPVDSIDVLFEKR